MEWCRGFRTFSCLHDFMTVCLWHNSTWYNANPSVPKMKDVQMFKSTMSENITERDDPEDGVFQEMYAAVVEAAYPQVRPPHGYERKTYIFYA